MSPRFDAGVRRSRRTRLAVLAGALIGLFAMHGLADHGTMHQPAAGSEPAAAAAHGATMHDGQVANSVVAWSSDPGDAGGDLSGLIGLCLAVLGVALVGFLRARGPAVRQLRRAPRASRQAAPNPARRRHRDPPCLFELSVQRC